MSKPVSGAAAGFLFTSVLGTLLHFLFDFTGGNIFAGVFSPVNESIWEHMKLLYFPMLLFALGEYSRTGRKDPRFWCTTLAGISLGLALIPGLYYLYTGILGVSADWFNVVIFFLAAGAAYLLQARGTSCRLSSRSALILIGLIGVIFLIFTFFPPRIPLFADPITGGYGLKT